MNEKKKTWPRHTTNLYIYTYSSVAKLRNDKISDDFGLRSRRHPKNVSAYKGCLYGGSRPDSTPCHPHPTPVGAGAGERDDPVGGSATDAVGFERRPPLATASLASEGSAVVPSQRLCMG